VERGCPGSVISEPGSERKRGNPKIQDQERRRMVAAGKLGAPLLARPKDLRDGATRNLVAGKDEICGNGATRTTQQEAKLEEQESE
jgi:hypothetical protein